MDTEELRELVAKWLFMNKYRFPNQRFYHGWHDEISASHLTEVEYKSLALEPLGIIIQAVEDIEFSHPVIQGMVSPNVAFQAGLHEARQTILSLLGKQGANE